MEANLPYAVVAKTNATFVSAGLTVDNLKIIYRIEGGILSWIPDRPINGITAFEAGKGYYLIPAAELDLSAYVVPPLTDLPTKPQALPPVITQDDTANTISASHDLGIENILVSTNDGAYVQYTGVISVGDVALSAGYFKFKTKETEDFAESDPALSAAFTSAAKPKADPPVITQDDTANTISASSPLGDGNILVSINGSAYQPYEGQISVPNADLSAGYYKFKTKETSDYAESNPAESAAFTYTPPVLPQVAPPVITQDDTANTISADFGDANSVQLQVSINNGAWANYTANEVINVDDVDLTAGYYRFKALGDNISYSDSEIAVSDAFTASEDDGGLVEGATRRDELTDADWGTPPILATDHQIEVPDGDDTFAIPGVMLPETGDSFFLMSYGDHGSDFGMDLITSNVNEWETDSYTLGISDDARIWYYDGQWQGSNPGHSTMTFGYERSDGNLKAVYYENGIRNELHDFGTVTGNLYVILVHIQGSTIKNMQYKGATIV